MLERCLDCSETPEPVHPTKVPLTKEEITSFRYDKYELIACCICGDQPRNTLATLGRTTTKATAFVCDEEIVGIRSAHPSLAALVVHVGT